MPAHTGTSMFKGSFTALLTPFAKGKVDDKAFVNFVDWQIREGTNGLVPVGTTGEAPTLSHDEHKHVISLCIEAAKGRVPIIAGAGSNSTDEAIELTEFAKKAGAQATLHSTGYYNKPTQEGLYLHFKAISDAVDLPIIVYNVPGRAVVDISAQTMGRIAELKNVAGIKDATANLQRMSQHRQTVRRKGFAYLTGDDATALGFNAHGGEGAISVTSNVAPRLCSDFQKACAAQDWKRALELHDILMPLHDALFVETNPTPVKYAAWRLGIIPSPECRLPMSPVLEPTKQAVDDALVKTGLLSKKAAE
jgi:4-hydroxy-tetrahydrodipicolinate synthase